MMAKVGRLPKAKLTTDYPCAPTISAASKKEAAERERRWRAEDDLRTCERYAEIEKDKQRMADMKALAKEKMNDLKKVIK